MAGHDIIVIGASAGGVTAMIQLVGGLPPGLPASLFVVCHFPPEQHSQLPAILSRSGPLLAEHAVEGATPYPGHIYVAPPDHHLTLDTGRMHLSREARENGLRPAIDPLFRSAARAYGPRVIAVVLSGASSDGVAGLMAVRSAGGIAVIQDPADAIISTLPEQARDIAGADHVAAAADLPALLKTLLRQPLSNRGGPNIVDPIDKMSEKVEKAQSEQIEGLRRGAVSVFGCPECGGCLWQVDEGEVLRFRCHVGHAYYADELMTEQEQALEAALWTAVRIFRERAVLARELAVRERERGNVHAADRFDEQAQAADRQSLLIKEHLLEGDGIPIPEAAASMKTP